MFTRSTTSAARKTLALLGLVAACSVHADEEQTNGAAPRPDRIVTQSQLLATGHLDLSRALSVLVSEYHYAPGVALNGSDHVLYGTLRGQAADHMVVLINGRRRLESALLATADLATRGSIGVDLNAIPLAAVRQVEITYGGQSAQYGSGAIAGVMNLVLDESAAGGWLTASWGQNRSQVNSVPEFFPETIDNNTLAGFGGGSLNVDDGDGDLLQLGGSWGFTLGESGYMRLSVDYRDDGGTNRGGFDPRVQLPLTSAGGLDIRELTVDRQMARYGAAERTDLNILFNAATPVSENVDLYGFTALGTREATSAAEVRRAVDTRNVIELYPTGYVPLIGSNIDDRSFVIGVRGSHWGWDWDASYNQGNSELDWSLHDSLNASFGAASPTSFSIGNNETSSISFLVQASRRVDWSRPLLLTIGVSVADEEYDLEVGEVASRANAGLVGGTSMHAESWSQGFAGFETEREEARQTVGVFTSLGGRLGANVEGQVALRLDDVDGLGSLFSGNASVDYAPAPAWRVRASAGVDYHAPSPAQQLYGHEQTVVDAGGVTRFGIFADPTPEALALGVSPLAEETSHNWRVRVMYAPNPDFDLQAEVYGISVKDRIVLSYPIAAATVAQQLSAAAIDDVTELSVFANAADFDTTGIEVTGRYGWALGGGDFAINWGVSLQRFDAARVSQLADGILPALELRQLEERQPDSKLLLGASWQRGGFDVRLGATRFGRVTDRGIDGYAADVDPAWLVDLAVDYRATPTLTLGVGVKNALDEYPAARSDGSVAAGLAALYPFSTSSPYGISGRYMYARAVARFP